MKGIAIDEFGGREVLRLRDDLPVPPVGPEDILVKVRAAGVNPVDWKIREGRLKGAFPHEFPLILGWEMAGVVEKLGDAAKGFSVGDEVYAYCRLPVVKNGAYAEYISIPASYAAKKPKNLSFTEAAGVPLTGLTVWQVFEKMDLQPGQTLLVHAAAGGVGSFAVQLARVKGATVIGTASEKNRDYVKGLGASEVVDYTKGDFRDAVRALAQEGVDAVFDTIGGETQKQSADILKDGGALISISGTPDAQALAPRQIRSGFVFVSPNAEQLGKLTALIEAGEVKVSLADVLPLAQAALAHEKSESGHTRGKIVLEM